MSKKIAGKAFDYSLFKRVMTYVKPYNGIFYTTAFLTIILALISLVRPLLIQITIDKYIKKLDEQGFVLHDHFTHLFFGSRICITVLFYITRKPLRSKCD